MGNIFEDGTWLSLIWIKMYKFFLLGEKIKRIQQENVSYSNKNYFFLLFFQFKLKNFSLFFYFLSLILIHYKLWLVGRDEEKKKKKRIK